MSERTNNNEPRSAPESTISALRPTRRRPGLGRPWVAPAQTELEGRVKARRNELVKRMVQLKHDTHVEAQYVREELAAEISEVGRLIKEIVVAGWANVSELAKRKLEGWLVRTFGEPKSWRP